MEGVYADADAALDYILSNQDVNNEDIFVLGHSLGGGVAVDLASRRGNQVGKYLSSFSVRTQADATAAAVKSACAVVASVAALTVASVLTGLDLNQDSSLHSWHQRFVPDSPA